MHADVYFCMGRKNNVSIYIIIIMSVYEDVHMYNPSQ